VALTALLSLALIVGGTFVPYTLNKGATMFDVSKVAPKFSLGQTVATPNALANIPNDEILNALSRHIRGDWGTLDAEDLQSNERALRSGGRLFSSYHSSQDVKFWIITECDRSVTTVLLPEDY
jgi:hypothetical protein